MALISMETIMPASWRREVQLDAHAVGIVEEDLLAAGGRDDLLAELDLLALELLTHAADVAGGEGDMVEADGVLELLLGAAHHDAFARRALAQEMHGGNAARVEPVAREAEWRPVAVLEPQHLAIELLGARQVRRFDGVVLQHAQWHCLLLRPR